MKLQLTLDKSAMGLSFLCLVHCLVLPIAAIVLPTLLAIPLNDEFFHQVLLIGVVPVSAVALLLGCKKHRMWETLAWGIAGLGILIFTAVLGHDLFGEIGEKVLTAIGSLLMIVSHYKNYRLCSKYQQCEC